MKMCEQGRAPPDLWLKCYILTLYINWDHTNYHSVAVVLLRVRTNYHSVAVVLHRDRTNYHSVAVILHRGRTNYHSVAVILLPYTTIYTTHNVARWPEGPKKGPKRVHFLVHTPPNCIPKLNSTLKCPVTTHMAFYNGQNLSQELRAMNPKLFT